MPLELPLRFVAETHQYFTGDLELPSVTRILSEARLADFSKPWFTAAVKDRGTMVHAAIALENEGALDYDALDSQLVGYVDGWRRYLAETGATVEHYEVAVCDRAAGYAGTLDAIVLEARQTGPTWRTVLDIKPAVYPSVGPQVAAYARCARQLYDGPTIFRRAALVLPGDGTYTRHPLEDAADERTFLAAVHLFHWRRNRGLCA